MQTIHKNVLLCRLPQLITFFFKYFQMLFYTTIQLMIIKQGNFSSLSFHCCIDKLFTVWYVMENSTHWLVSGLEFAGNVRE